MRELTTKTGTKTKIQMGNTAIGELLTTKKNDVPARKARKKMMQIVLGILMEKKMAEQNHQRRDRSNKDRQHLLFQKISPPLRKLPKLPNH